MTGGDAGTWVKKPELRKAYMRKYHAAHPAQRTDHGPPPYRCDRSCGDSKCKRRFDTWSGFKGHAARQKNPPGAAHDQDYVTPRGGARTRVYAFQRYMNELGSGKKFTALDFNDWLINNYPMLTIGRAGSWLVWNAKRFGAQRGEPNGHECVYWVTP